LALRYARVMVDILRNELRFKAVLAARKVPD
jgi:hypothetical protein